MTSVPLPASAPSAQGVAAGGVQAFLDRVEATPGVEPHSLMILRHGHLVAAGWWRPYTPDRPHLLYSLSKSFTSTAAGIAVAEGLLGLDDPVIDHFPELDAEVTDRRTRSMLVRHIAAMSSGHVEETWQRVVAADPENPVRAFLLLPPERDPGTVFAYNQSCTYTLGTIVQRLTGQTLTEYLRPRLLDPLGAGEVSWMQLPPGRDLGFSGLHATTDTFARLGELYLHGGSWQDRQLLSPEWVAEATRSHVSTGDGQEQVEPRPVDWQQGYGFQFWRSRHGYRADGAYGQFCVVLPEQDAVIAMTSQCSDTQALLQAMWDELLPAFGEEAAPAGEADAALAERLGRLALPASKAWPAPGGDEEAWDGSSFQPDGGSRTQQPSLLSVQVTSGAEGWQVALDEGDWQLSVPLGGDWVTTSSPAPGGALLPTASCGGWLDQDTLRLELVFLETPHRLAVTCLLPSRTFQARWATTPLHLERLGALHAPHR